MRDLLFLCLAVLPLSAFGQTGPAEATLKSAQRAYSQGLYGEAESQYLQAEKEAESHGPNDPRLARVLNNLGVLYSKQGLYGEAIATFEQALQIDPSNATVQGNLANARTDKATMQEREARIADARKEAEARPNDPRAAYNLARVYAALDMKEPALEWLSKALELGFADIGFLRDDPALAGLKNDPRLTRLLEGP